MLLIDDFVLRVVPLSLTFHVCLSVVCVSIFEVDDEYDRDSVDDQKDADDRHKEEEANSVDETINIQSDVMEEQLGVMSQQMIDEQALLEQEYLSRIGNFDLKEELDKINCSKHAERLLAEGYGDQVKKKNDGKNKFKLKFSFAFFVFRAHSPI